MIPLEPSRPSAVTPGSPPKAVKLKLAKLLAKSLPTPPNCKLLGAQYK